MQRYLSEAQVQHLATTCELNAKWHRAEYKASGDRYHLGQWKAYWRIAYRLRHMEYDLEMGFDFGVTYP